MCVESERVSREREYRESIESERGRQLCEQGEARASERERETECVKQQRGGQELH